MSLPDRIPPMLAISGKPFDSAEHFFEPKWDGIRCIAINAGSLCIHSRSLREITPLFPEVVGHKLLKGDLWAIDGELICLDANGKPSFEQIKRRLVLKTPGSIAQSSKLSPAIYVIFDLLYHKGESFMDKPLYLRRETLEDEFIKTSNTQLSPIVPHRGIDLYQTICQHQLEGIMAKQINSPYLPGKRSTAWIKVRSVKTEVFHIIGYIPKSEHSISSLALAKRDDDGWEYVGQVGSGFKDTDHAHLLTLFPGLITKERVVRSSTHVNQLQHLDIRWIRPVLKCQVEFLEYSPQGVLRHPVFKGLVNP